MKYLLLYLLLFDAFTPRLYAEDDSSGGYTLFSKLWSGASTVVQMVTNLRDPVDMVLDAALDPAFEKLQEVVDYKARVAQARYFLGDTFAEAFGNYIKEQERLNSSLGISASAIIDSSEYIKAATDTVADTIVGGIVIKVEAGVLRNVLPYPFDQLGDLLENQTVLSWTRMLGTGLAYLIFPPNAFAMTVVALLPYIAKNLWVFQVGFREACQMVRRMRKGAIALAATELIDPSIPPFLLSDFVERNRAILATDGWPKDALAKMTSTIPMPLFVEYYTILIEHFPEALSGPSSIVSSGFGWIFSRPSDQVLRYADIVGIFRLPAPENGAALLRFIQSMHPESKGQASRLDEASLMIIDYYLLKLRVPQQLGRGCLSEDALKMCQVITKLFMGSNETIEFVVRGGLLGLSTLAARLLPLGGGKDTDGRLRPTQATAKVVRHGMDLVSFAIREAKPLAMLTVLRNVDIPKDYALELLRPVLDQTCDGASRTRRFVFEAFYLLRHQRVRAQLCRPLLYPQVGPWRPLAELPINLSFLDEARIIEAPLTEEEIKHTAVAVANLLFDIPIEECLALKRVGGSVIETVNLYMANHCGFFRGRMIKAIAVSHDTSTAHKPNRPLPSSRQPFKAKASRLPIPQ